jgi:predicted metal-binding membrane protein
MKAALVGLREIARGPFWFLPGVALAAWAYLIASDRELLSPRLCGANGLDALLTFGLPAALTFNSASTIALSWVLMLAAMTAPLLHRPLLQVRVMSFAERRWRGTALFLLGFAATWLLAIALLVLCALALRTVLNSDPFLPFFLVLGATITWYGTSRRQQSLNRCHAVVALPAFGLAAEWGSIHFGFVNACACIGACWPLMLLPFVAGAEHLYVMAGTTVLMFVQRYGRLRAARTNAPIVLAGSAVVILSTAAALL